MFSFTNKSKIAKQVSLALVSFPAALSTAIAAPQAEPFVTESGMSVAPFVNLTTGYNDNVTKRVKSSALKEVDSWFTVVEPGVIFSITPANQSHSLSYRLQRGDFFDSKDDNYTDQFLDLATLFQLGQKSQLTFDYNLALTHDPRGDNDVIDGDSTNELAKFATNDVNLGYQFGNIDSIGRIATNIGWGNKGYSNLKETTQYQEWDELRGDIAFYYKAFPKTSLFLQLQANDRSYAKIASGAASRDSLQSFAFVGLEWDTTGKLQGQAKVGYQNKDFDASSRKDFDSASWDVGLTFLPRTYSTIQLSTNRSATDPDGDTDYIDAYTHSASWNHGWSEKVSTDINYSLTTEDYSGSSREDDTANAGVSISYDFRRWLSFKLGASIEQKDSTQANSDYDQNVYYLSIEGVI